MAKKAPRPAATYRGARRNLWRKTKQHWDTLKFEHHGQWRAPVKPPKLAGG